MSAKQPLESAHQALREARAADARVAALCELGESALDQAALLDGQDETRGVRQLRDAARDHGFEASRIALHAADPQWEITVLLRVSELFDRLGDHDDAIALQCRAAGLMTRQAIRGSGAVVPLRP
jgi:type II secretory pathway component PulM